MVSTYYFAQFTGTVTLTCAMHNLLSHFWEWVNIRETGISDNLVINLTT